MFLMKRQLLSFIVLLALLNPLALKVGVVMYWKYNQRIIAQTLCENKSKPQLKCNGKCQLKKRLQQVSENKENEKTPPLQAFKLLKIDQFIPACRPAIPVHLIGAFQTASPVAYAETLYRIDFIKYIFHPPQA